MFRVGQGAINMICGSMDEISSFAFCGKIYERDFRLIHILHFEKFPTTFLPDHFYDSLFAPIKFFILRNESLVDMLCVHCTYFLV